MARCAQDLANPADRRPVSAIALRWGFQDIPHFTRTFGAAFGCTPSAYRLRHGGSPLGDESSARLRAG